MSARLIASQVIQQSIERKMTLSLSLSSNEAFKNAGEKKALIQEISYGTFRWYNQLEYILAQLVNRKLKKKDTLLKCLILIGLYQLRFMRIPQHAVVSETVNICKKIDMLWAKGLVNAILRRYIRESKQLELAFNNNQPIKTAHPVWLFEQLQHDWPEYAKDILRANNEKPPMYLRVNQRKQSRAQYLEKLKQSGIEGTATSYSKNGILLTQAKNVEQLPDFANGAISVQELAAQFSTELLDLKADQTVLDACAAPGGKSAHILETEANLESLSCIEKDPNRSLKLTETLNRLGLKAKVKTADVTELDSWWDNTLFDRILLDSPCSATGVIRRHPDIKFLRTKQEINNITALQIKLLNTLWQTLKPGGLLLYVTCSVFKQENSSIIEAFINENSNCQLVPIETSWGIDTGYGRQIITGQDNMDGFFYARLKKK